VLTEVAGSLSSSGFCSELQLDRGRMRLTSVKPVVIGLLNSFHGTKEFYALHETSPKLTRDQASDSCSTRGGDV